MKFCKKQWKNAAVYDKIGYEEGRGCPIGKVRPKYQHQI